MDFVPYSRPHIWHITATGREAIPLFVLGSEKDLRSISYFYSPPPLSFIQLLMWTCRRSGRKVRLQLGHCSRALLLQVLYAASLYASNCEGLLASMFSGPVGTGFRRCLGFFASSYSHRFIHCFWWIAMDLVPYSRPQMWHMTALGLLKVLGLISSDWLY